MGRTATLEPRRDSAKDLWYVSVPPRLSTTGKRKREYFGYRREAERRSKELLASEKMSLSLIRKAGPRLIQDAVTFDELFQIYGFSGLREACEKFAAMLEAERKTTLFADLIAAYETDHWDDWSDESRKTWRRIKADTADLGERNVSQLDTGFWSDWLRSKATDLGWSARTFNDIAGRIASVWIYGEKQGLSGKNPIAGVKRRKIRKKSVAVLTLEQVSLILHTAWDFDREMVPYFAIGIFAGLRPQCELKALLWEDVNFDEGWLRVRFGNKTDTKRFVPIEPALAAWLRPWIGATGPVVPKNLTKRRRYVVRGKYQAKPDAPEKDWKLITGWPRDIMRHSYGSYLEAQCKDRNIVKENMGHTDFKTYEQHYRNARTPKQAEAFWAILPPKGEKVKSLAA